MKTLTTHAQITNNGLLKLEVPCDLSPGEVEIVLVIQPIKTNSTIENNPSYRSLHGIWAGKLPDTDVDIALLDMSQMWKNSLEVSE